MRKWVSFKFSKPWVLVHVMMLGRFDLERTESNMKFDHNTVLTHICFMFSHVSILLLHLIIVLFIFLLHFPCIFSHFRLNFPIVPFISSFIMDLLAYNKQLPGVVGKMNLKKSKFWRYLQFLELTTFVTRNKQCRERLPASLQKKGSF